MQKILDWNINTINIHIITNKLMFSKRQSVDFLIVKEALYLWGLKNTTKLNKELQKDITTMKIQKKISSKCIEA